MSTQESLTRETRNQLIESYEQLEQELKNPNLSEQEMDRLDAVWERTKADYFDRLPRITMSRCPFCVEPFVHSFDPWGVDGYWWQERELGETEEPPACEHYTVLQGALSLQGKPPRGGDRETARVGPDVPFVIPRLLERPDTVAVVSSVTMECGYLAYPIVYFSKGGNDPEGLTNPWRRTSFEWMTDDGEPAWAVSNDPWDFDLKAWIDKGRIFWILGDDPKTTIRGPNDGPCPYVNLPGVREQQVLIRDELTTKGVPEGDEPEPFE